ncbi:MAG: hypothetical protein EPO36_00860 [Chloroflexota bacterium]|nr:MAG: hypothetical protein EPO36_00860 [Chloroflexota bacterium]
MTGSARLRSIPRRLIARRPARTVAILTLSLALAGCASIVRGHAEIGPTAGDTMELGTIEPSSAGRTVHVEVDVTAGAVRLELVGPDATVWTATGSPDTPIRGDVPMPANAGPWQVQLTALEPPGIADYRIDTR